MSTQIDHSSMRTIGIILICLLQVSSAFASPLLKNLDRTSPVKPNNPRFAKQPVLVLVSIDGARHDYPTLHKMETLQEMAKEGTSMDGLIPVFPSKTFPNHYSIVTGMWPRNHGIWENNFYDPELKKAYSPNDPFTVRDGRWYKAPPLWSLAESEGLRTASFFWVGSEAKIAGQRPTYWIPYNPQIPNEDRVEQVLKWVSLPPATRPGFITLYFSAVDDAGHSFGPLASETRDAAQKVDRQIKALWEGLKRAKIPYVLVVVSDHGMTNLDPKKTIDLSQLALEDDFEIQGSGSFVTLYLKKPERREEWEKKLRQTLEPNVQVISRQGSKSSAPKAIPDSPQWFGLSSRLGDFVLAAHSPWYMDMPKRRKSQQAASHGWNPDNREMHGIFFAVGSGVPKGLKIGSFENTSVFYWMARTIGVPVRSKIDGGDILHRLLKPELYKDIEN